MTSDIKKQIEELNKQVEDLKQKGKYQEGIPIAEKACELSKEEYGEEHPEYANNLNALAGLYYYMGNYSSAESLFIRVKEIMRKTLGEEHLDYAQCLNNLAIIYVDNGDYSIAEPLHLQALEIRKNKLGEKHLDYARSLHGLAILHYYKGNYSSAEMLYLQVKEIRRKALGEDHLDYAQSLNNLAILYRDIGNYSSAESLLLRAKEIRRKALGVEHPEYAKILNNLANLYADIGNNSVAESLYLESLEIRRKTLGEEHPEYAQSINNLAILYADLGNYLTAESLHLQAKEIRCNTLGKEHLDYAASLNNLASVYRNIGNYPTAVSLHLQAKEIRLKKLGEEHRYYATSLHNLAMIYNEMGYYSSAEPLHLKANKIWLKAFGDKHPEYAKTQDGLCQLYAATNRNIEALECQRQVIGVHDHLITQIFSFASDHQRLDYLKQIQPSFDTYISLIFQHFSQSLETIQATLNLILRRKAIAAEALAAQRDAVLGGKYPELKEKLKELTTHRMQIALKELRGPGPEGKESHDQIINEWTEKKEKLESELARYIPEMNLEEKLRAADRKAVAQALPKDSVLVEFVKFNEYDFKAIPAKGEKHWKPARYLAFVLPFGKPDQVTMIDLGEAEPIDKLIDRYRALILSGFEFMGRSGAKPVKISNGNRTKDPGLKLRKLVFDKLKKSLKGYKHIFISPDGNLSRLPFETLPTKDSRYLIDDYNISYLSVGRDVLRFNAHSHRIPQDSLIAADPDFDMGSLESPQVKEPEKELCSLGGLRKSRDFDRSSLKFERLPGTRPESDLICKILETKPWLEDEVLEGKLKSLHSPFILHLATHGFFLEDQKVDPGMEKGPRYENPLLRSGLALAGANTSLKGGTLPDEAEDGILTAEDVSGLDLTDTELVVLSACDTGLGEIRTGEGVFGLRRAFMLAGAKTLVMSLWKVNDIATPILMERFYDNLLNKGLARNESLREAQMYLRGVTIREIRNILLSGHMIEQFSAGNALLRQEIDQFLELPDDVIPFNDPFFWGAFICQGDPSPVQR